MQTFKTARFEEPFISSNSATRFRYHFIFKYFTSTERTRGGDDLQEGLQRPQAGVEEVQPPVLRGHPPVLDMAPVPHQQADEGARQQGAQETQLASLFDYFLMLVCLVVIRQMRLIRFFVRIVSTKKLKLKHAWS